MTFGYCRLTGNAFVPGQFRVLLAAPRTGLRSREGEAIAGRGGPSKRPGTPARSTATAAFASIAEAVVNNLREVGGSREPAAGRAGGVLQRLWREKVQNLIMGGSAAFGNAATRLEAFAIKGGAYAYDSYPDIDALFQQQAAELDHKKREVLLQKIQQLVHERVIAAPIWQLAALSGVGPRVGESTFGLIPGYPWTSPYEDITLRAERRLPKRR